MTHAHTVQAQTPADTQAPTATRPRGSPTRHRTTRRLVVTGVCCAFGTALGVGCARATPAPALTPPQLQVAAPEARLSYTQLLVAAQDALAAGHADAAITLAADACRLDAARPEAFVVRGRALAQHDHVADSSAQFERARALGCRDAQLYMALASNYDVEHRYPEAVAVYLDYLSDHPHDAAMRDELGLTYLLLGAPDDAIAQLRQALRAAPDSLQIRQDLGYALLASHAFAEAEVQLARVCAAPEPTPEAKLLWAQALTAQHKWQQALGVVTQLTTQYPLNRGAQHLQNHLATHLNQAPAGGQMPTPGAPAGQAQAADEAP